MSLCSLWSLCFQKCRGLSARTPIFTKSLKQRCHYDKFLVNVSFCMCKIAKPSLLMTQFARRGAFVANLELVPM